MNMRDPELALNPPALLTERLLLRAPTEADLDSLYEVHADPGTNRFNPSGPMNSRAAAEALLRDWQAHWQTRGFGYWLIARREQAGPSGLAGEEQVLGFGGLMHKPIDGQQGLNLYFRFRPQAWGQGYASEMALAALELAFGRLQAPAVLGVVRPANMPSRKTLERIGMRLKGCWADVPGQAASLLYEMTASHWAELPRQSAVPTPFGA
ncbi:GNAT family N-acetyltransferase [Paucibacter sp. APW11]|uniref:GNAT family N-acetyltransferase n=1 Tax=Roseateles aquae TaxID=3077235 RepID=A0ABU3PCM2_9BURK|nr:GNAT family N-acetyltransferase [Paucibacter sp. APW11]MDT9000338.1 GNAT family N-acetyltransferase [Paucibacter sp. APW11]